MQESLAQTLHDLSSTLVQPHDWITQLIIASVVGIGLLLCCAFWFAREAYQVGQLLEHAHSMAETDWNNDVAPWPIAAAESAQQGKGKATLGVGKHVAGDPGSVVMGPE